MAKSLKIPKEYSEKQINEGQRTQWPKLEDTKGLISRHKSMKDREHNGQKFEDTKGVIRRHKSMTDREHYCQKFEDTKGLIRRQKLMKDRQRNDKR